MHGPISDPIIRGVSGDDTHPERGTEPVADDDATRNHEGHHLGLGDDADPSDYLPDEDEGDH